MFFTKSGTAIKVISSFVLSSALVVGLGISPSDAFAEAQERIVAFAVPEDAQTSSLVVTECAYTNIVSATEIVFRCPPRERYAVRYHRVADGVEIEVSGQAEPRLVDDIPEGYPGWFVSEYDAPDAAAQAGAARTDDMEMGVVPLSKPKPVVSIRSNARIGEINLEGPIRKVERDDGGDSNDSNDDAADMTIMALLTGHDAEDAVYRVVAARNPACAQEFPAKSSAVTFDPECRTLEIALPEGLSASSDICDTDAGKLTCLLPKGTKTVPIKVEGWSDYSIILPGDQAPEGEAGGVSFSANAVPDIDAGRIVAGVGREFSGLSGLCKPEAVTLRFSGYCPADGDCQPTDPRPLSEGLPSLEKAGWERSEGVPEAFLVTIAREGRRDMAQVRVALSMTPEEMVAEILLKVEQPPYDLLLLNVGDLSLVGGELVAYPSSDCTGPPDSRIVLKEPFPSKISTKACGSVRLEESNVPISRCHVASLNNMGTQPAAFPLKRACDEKRIVVLVAQNQSFNGPKSEAVIAALRARFEAHRASDKCYSVDFVATQDERRDVLVDASALFLGDSPEDFNVVSTLQFVSPRSEIIRDFRWIYDKWGERKVAGLIVIADATQIFTNDRRTSVEALAWDDMGVEISMLDLSGTADCDFMKQKMKFDFCESVDEQNIDAILAQRIDTTQEKMK